VVGERTIPLLPCGSIDEVEDFYQSLGFTRTYRQVRPNPYVAMERDDIALGFFGMPGFDPADSYGSCVVIVTDIAALHAAFATGMRERYGKIPASGIPRITRPRPRKNADGLTGFSVVDPGGNWIRIMTAAKTGDDKEEPTRSASPPSRLADALANAVVLGDSKGDDAQARKIVDGALRRNPDAPVTDRIEALVYLAELTIRLGDHTAAGAALDTVDELRGSVAEGAAHSAFIAAADLRRHLIDA